MFDGNWRQFVKARGGLIASTFGALLFVIVFAWPAALEQREIQDDAARHAEYYSADAQNDVAAKCGALAGQARDDCAHPIEDAAREAQRNEQDLAAQQTMAIWTAVMGGVAVIGVALSALGVYLIWQTWAETRRAAGTSEKTYSAFIALERPTLVVKIGPPRMTMLEWVEFELGATNIGKSACVVTMSVATWRATEKFDEVKGYMSAPQHVFVEGAGTGKIAMIKAKIGDLKTKPIIGGIIKYHSPLKEDHKSFFCFRLVEDDGKEGLKFHVIDVKGEDWPEDS